MNNRISTHYNKITELFSEHYTNQAKYETNLVDKRKKNILLTLETSFEYV
ncbi:hypothetical protein [uncultured Aquimarina sp.]|nr:hypothetical protein [uncultured Aquimarina sp.]